MPRGTSRRVDWGGAVQDTTNLTNGAAKLFTLANHATLSAESAAPTIVRIRGRIIVNLNADTDTQTQSSAFWAGIITMDDGLVGSGNAPNPYFRPEANWLWFTHGRVWAAYENSTMKSGHRKEAFEIDTRAMRIVREGLGLYLLVHTIVGPSDTQIANISYGLRWLLKE